MLQEVLSKFSTPADKQAYLQQLTAAYPYFAPAQFCLLQTLQPGTDAYNHRAAIVHLLYNNAHWLQYQIAHSSDTNAPKEPVALQEALHNEVSDTAAPIAPGPANTLAEGETTSNEMPSAEMDHTTAQEDTADTAPIIEATNTITDSSPEQPSLTPDTEAADTKVPDATVITESTTTEKPATQPEEKATETLPLLFEPLFAVDYFASQGIKLSEDMQQGDKLGQQLKSFTDWLKSLKKGPDSVQEKLNPAAEAVVQNIAEKSNTEDDVVTEAMAEVFALQGRRQKAAEIYRKLSLLNPHKSAYFAAKIENLK